MSALQIKINEILPGLVTITDEDFKTITVNSSEKYLCFYEVAGAKTKFKDFMFMSKRLQRIPMSSARASLIAEHIELLEAHNVKLKFAPKLTKENKVTFTAVISLKLANVKEGQNPHVLIFSDGKREETKLGFITKEFTIDPASTSVMEAIVTYIKSFTVETTHKKSFVASFTRKPKQAQAGKFGGKHTFEEMQKIFNSYDDSNIKYFVDDLPEYP